MSGCYRGAGPGNNQLSSLNGPRKETLPFNGAQTGRNEQLAFERRGTHGQDQPRGFGNVVRNS